MLAITRELDTRIGGPPNFAMLGSKRHTLYGDSHPPDEFLNLFDFPPRPTSEARALIERAYELLYSHPPQPGETDLALAFLADSSIGETTSRWESYTQALLAANEFRRIQ